MNYWIWTFMTKIIDDDDDDDDKSKLNINKDFLKFLINK